MKIGMMCLWNAANGPSIHAELVGRAWVKLVLISGLKQLFFPDYFEQAIEFSD
jgi:hypothetical protein